MVYSTSVSFDSVIVLQSLAPRELQTGKDLFETTLAPVSVMDPGFVTELRDAHSRHEFLAHMDDIARNAREFGRSPVLHIETHGGREGIRLSNDEVVPWGDVAPKLAALNYISRMNLLVVAAMCRGWHMSDILRPTDRSPAFGVIGTTEKLSAGALLCVMQTFYDHLLHGTHDLTAALRAANEVAEARGVSFEMVGAELLLCKVFRAYLESLAHEETQEQRVNRLVADMARIQGLDVTGTMQIRSRKRNKLDDHEAWFESYRQRFLMLDEFPENSRRFKQSYADCMGWGL